MSLAAAVLFVSASALLAAGTQIRTDGTVGTAGYLGVPQTITGVPNSGGASGSTYSIKSASGSIAGNNLFYSFATFDLANNDTALFLGPSSIQNIITRVTGGAASSIDGTIDTMAMPNANFFFINPFGIIFGPDAALNVGGSFHATTADYLGFSDGTRFLARNQMTPVLSVADPSAFGFLSSNPASISANGSTLTVADQATLSLVGGNVTLDGATAGAAFAGSRASVNLYSVAGPGEVTLGGVTGSTPLGTVQISNLSTVLVEGGTLRVRAGKLELTNGASLESIPDSPDPDGSVIDIVAGEVAVADANILDQNEFGATNGGRISIAATTIDLSSGSNVESVAFFPTPSGTSGSVSLNASRSISITGGSFAGSRTLAAIDAGSVFVTAPLLLVDDSTIESASIAQPGASGPAGSSGSLAIRAGTIQVIDGGQITTSTQTSGNGGKITINANTLLLASGGAISANSVGSGNAGDIVLGLSATFDSQNGTVTTATTQSAGGNITLSAGNLMRLQESSITTSVSGGSGNGGNIAIDSKITVLQNGSVIAANAFGGNGGNIAITAAGVFQSPDSSITASSNLGVNGNISVNAPDTNALRGLAVLPTGFLDAAAQLRTACSAHNASGPVSSLVGVGRGTVPAGPEGLLVGSYGQGTARTHQGKPAVSDHGLIDQVSGLGLPRRPRETRFCGG